MWFRMVDSLNWTCLFIGFLLVCLWFLWFWFMLIRLSKRILFLERNCLSNHCIRRRSTYFDTMGKTVEETYKKVNHLKRKLWTENDHFRLTISSMFCYVRTCTWDLSNLSVKTCGFMTLKPIVLSQKVKTSNLLHFSKSIWVIL